MYYEEINFSACRNACYDGRFKGIKNKFEVKNNLCIIYNCSFMDIIFIVWNYESQWDAVHPR